ncbi:transposase [candidate division TA06 bacterium]|uniref:Transposase n=1 Tax=candidate division TA06 bacterium TaxID=2250710 RepID=A0A933MJ37_UNCT6|nr:transposase [candidate division TA06 bacterium]
MPKGIRKLHISLGEHNLTHFGGIFLIHHFCQRIKLKHSLQKTVRQTHRQRDYNQAELILAIIYALIVGIPRLSKTKILQGNGAFQKIIGLRSYPYASSLRRFIKSITKATNDQLDSVHDSFRQKVFSLSKPSASIIFDFDSTIITVYGKYIEGAEVGYNPHKRGARSYHPLLCFEAHTRDYWHGILRSGDRYISYGSVDFLKIV